MEGIMEHISEDGSFTDGFAPAVIEALGEGYVENDERGRCKHLDDIKSVTALAKTAIDTRRANAKLSESEFRRPDDNATDEVKTAYTKRLKTELGASDKLEDYMFGKPENFPEDMTWDEENAKKWAQYFLDKGYPVSMVKELTKDMHAETVEGHNAKKAAAKIKLAADIKGITDAHQEPARLEMGRLVCKYIELFLSDEVKEKTKGMYEDAANIEEWNKRGVSPQQWLHMATVAKVTQSSGPLPPGTPSGTPSEDQADKDFVNKVNALSPALQSK
jgi:hypothetical protein